MADTPPRHIDCALRRIASDSIGCVSSRPSPSPRASGIRAMTSTRTASRIRYSQGSAHNRAVSFGSERDQTAFLQVRLQFTGTPGFTSTQRQLPRRSAPAGTNAPVNERRNGMVIGHGRGTRGWARSSWPFRSCARAATFRVGWSHVGERSRRWWRWSPRRTCRVSAHARSKRWSSRSALPG
jgi:hypothetical protein